MSSSAAHTPRLLRNFFGGLVTVVIGGCLLGPVMMWVAIGVASLLLLFPAMLVLWLLQLVSLAPADAVVTLRQIFLWTSLALGVMYVATTLTFALGRRFLPSIARRLQHLIPNVANSAFAALASAPFLSLAINGLFHDAPYLESSSAVDLVAVWRLWIEESQGILTLEFPRVPRFDISPINDAGLLIYHVWFVKTVVFSEMVALARTGALFEFDDANDRDDRS